MSTIETSRGIRLDQHVIEQLPEMSRGYAVQLINEGQVIVNGKPSIKAGYRLRPTDIIEVLYKPEEASAIPEIDLPIIFEDEECVVIDKPLGLLSHSKGAFNPEATVATWLKSHITDIDESERAGIVHRLDRATSGIMICAKTAAAQSWLQKQFSQRRVKKTYIAIVAGAIKNEQAVIDMPIERNPKKPQTFRVGNNGKTATTEYKVIQTNDNYSVVELKPFTGRTHQLRVHLEEIGHPIVGDILYDGLKADRMYLHARHLELTLPSRERKTFSSDLPPEFAEFMASHA
jgi:23S rRNA pseudouridine1911/1915/1917 synthase